MDWLRPTATLAALSLLSLACPQATPAAKTAVTDGSVCKVADATPGVDERPDEAWLRAFYFECVKKTAWRSDPVAWERDAGPIRLTGPYISGKGFGSHQRVQVWYSPAMAQWLRDRDAALAAESEVPAIPVGARMIKEMYLDPPQPKGTAEAIDGVAFMERTDGTSYDGWLWALYFPPNSKTTGRPLGFASVQHGSSFCQTCHSVVADGNGTFAHLGNLNGRDVVSYTLLEEILADRVTPLASELGPHGTLAHQLSTTAAGQCVVNPLKVSGVLPCDRELDPSFDPAVPGMASIIYNDDVVPGNANPTGWATGAACRYCHDAALLQGGRTPEMMIVEDPHTAEHAFYNLSPYSEASASLMMRSARDPVFLAQMEYERERYAKAGDKVSDFCLQCHAPMGRRAFAEAGKGPFREEILHTRPGDPEAVFGSLARDGVSCNVCHRLEVPAPDALDDAYNANFAVSPSDQIYGPFENPKPLAMEQAIGVTPVHSTDIGRSEVCTSCHTVRPPIVPVKRASADWDSLPRADEQMTYWEWANSDFPGEEQSCVGCHMPDKFLGEALPEFRIANIQTPEFPYSHAHPDPAEVELEARSGYRRHTLTGINLFSLEMFRLLWYRMGVQFAQVGLPNSTFPHSEVVSREAAVQARERTARLTVKSAPKATGLSIDVEVESLVGHKFPSGVHFRRAWLEVRVEDAAGNPLWCSGCPDVDGWIESFDGHTRERVASESATHASELQKSWTVIDDPHKVALYEEAYSQNGEIVISFLGLETRLKDTKISPRGWRPDGPKGAETQPVTCPEGSESCGVPVNPRRPGWDSQHYEVTLAPGLPRPDKVAVTLHYQALPPRYLATLGVDGEHRKHLVEMVECLKKETEHRLFDGWTVPVACERVPASGGPAESCLAPLPERTPREYYMQVPPPCI